MINKIDITDNNFDRIDFTESTIIDFQYNPHKPDLLCFSVWGATLLLGEYWEHDKNFLIGHTEDMYVAGVGIVSVEGFCSGELEVHAYDNELDKFNKIIFAKNHKGSHLIYKKSWEGLEETENIKEYLWECVISWPYGFCNMKILSIANVSFEFNTNDLISVNEYLKNTKNYRFQLKK